MRNIQNLILDNYDLSDYKIERVLSTACAKNIDFADIYFQYKSAESWTLEDGIVKNGSSSIDSGVGIRSVCDDKSGFAYSNDFNYKNLVSAGWIAAFNADNPGLFIGPGGKPLYL